MAYVTELFGWRVTTPDAGPPTLEVHDGVSEGHMPYGDQDPSEIDGFASTFLTRCALGPSGGVRCPTPHRSARRHDFIGFPTRRDGG